MCSCSTPTSGPSRGLRRPTRAPERSFQLCNGDSFSLHTPVGPNWARGAPGRASTMRLCHGALAAGMPRVGLPQFCRFDHSGRPRSIASNLCLSIQVACNRIKASLLHSASLACVRLEVAQEGTRHSRSHVEVHTTQLGWAGPSTRAARAPGAHMHADHLEARPLCKACRRLGGPHTGFTRISIHIPSLGMYTPGGSGRAAAATYARTRR